MLWREASRQVSIRDIEICNRVKTEGWNSNGLPSLCGVYFSSTTFFAVKLNMRAVTHYQLNATTMLSYWAVLSFKFFNRSF